MTAMSAAARARWFNPTTAEYTTIAGSPLANTGTRAFTPPGDNGPATPTGPWSWTPPSRFGGLTKWQSAAARFRRNVTLAGKYLVWSSWRRL
jgi:hypothetical protein